MIWNVKFVILNIHKIHSLMNDSCVLLSFYEKAGCQYTYTGATSDFTKGIVNKLGNAKWIYSLSFQNKHKMPLQSFQFFASELLITRGIKQFPDENR